MRAPAPPLLGARTLDESDELLLARSRQGSEAAFAVLVRRHERALVRHCARLLGEASALDAAQDAFIAAWSEIRSGTEIGSLRPWLLTVAHRKALAQLRERRRAPTQVLAETVAGASSPADQALRAARVGEVLSALAALPRAQREALVGIAVHGRSGRQVARELGVSEGAARQLVFRARAALRSGAASCLAPPLLALRWLRRLAGPPMRAAAAAQSGALGGWERAAATTRLFKFAVLAIAGAGAVGAGALKLAVSPRPAVTTRARPGLAGSDIGPVTGSVLATAGAMGSGGGLLARSGRGTRAGSRLVSAAPLGSAHAGGRTVRRARHARRTPPGGAGGALDQSPAARAAVPPIAGAPPAVSRVASIATTVGAGAVPSPAGARRAAAGVPALPREVGAAGHGGGSLVTGTLAGGGRAVGSTVKQAVSTASGAVSTLADTVAVAGTLTAAVAPLVAVIEPGAGANPPVGATAGIGTLPGAVVQTLASGGSAAGTSASGVVSTVTQTVAGVVQAGGATTNKVVQGATGAVSALGHLP